LAEYQFHAGILEQNGISTYALSTDPIEKAQETVQRAGAAYPVLYGMDGRALAQTWGGYYEERRNILHATAFVLRPDRTIASATYSTGPVGRLLATDAARIVAFYRKQAAAK
jgi:peroxiredoxin